MSDPCGQETVIRELKDSSRSQATKIDKVLENQAQQSKDLKAAIDRLTAIIEADIGTRKDVEQLKKEVELLFSTDRSVTARLDAIEIRNAKCDGAGIFDSWPSIQTTISSARVMLNDFDDVYEEYQQNKGIRKFVPTVMTVLSFLILLWVTFAVPSIEKSQSQHSHEKGSVKSDVGVK